jgi:hypothetical protein
LLWFASEASHGVPDLIRLRIAFDRSGSPLENAANRSLRGRNRASIRDQPLWLRRSEKWNAQNWQTAIGIDRRVTAPCHGPGRSEMMLLDRTPRRRFERRLDPTRSRRSWSAATAAATTLLRASSSVATAVVGSASPNATGHRHRRRRQASRSSGHIAGQGIGLRKLGPFPFHVLETGGRGGRQKSPASSKSLRSATQSVLFYLQSGDGGKSARDAALSRSMRTGESYLSTDSLNPTGYSPRGENTVRFTVWGGFRSSIASLRCVRRDSSRYRARLAAPTIQGFVRGRG